MLARYHMRRGATVADLPDGIRQDTRRHTRHPLRPDRELVDAFLDGSLPYVEFAAGYQATVRQRMTDDPAPFDALAELARKSDVYLGCSCPTKGQPDVRRCHTWLALTLMQQAYPDLDIRFPEG